MPRSRPASAGPRDRPAAAAGGAASAAALLRRSGSASPRPSSALDVRRGRSDRQAGDLQLGVDLHVAGRPASARSRPPLLVGSRPNPPRARSDAENVTAAHDSLLWTPPPDVGPGRSASPATRLGTVASRDRQRSHSMEKCATRCPADIVPRDAELALLRARFDLRLDAERVRTQDTSSELRNAYDDAFRAQQESTASQLRTMQQGYDEMAALQRCAEQSALRVVQAEGEEAATALRAEVTSCHHHSEELAAELSAMRMLERAEASAVVAARADEVAAIEASRAQREQDAAEAHRSFQERRELQVSEIVARFEHEHFQMTVKIAEEVERRKSAVLEVSEFRDRFEELQCIKSVPQMVDASASDTVSQGTQTEATEGFSLLSTEEELKALRLADVESLVWNHSQAEAIRLRIIDERMRKSLALKDDTIVHLKNELLHKQREIFDARAILARKCGFVAGQTSISDVAEEQHQMSEH